MFLCLVSWPQLTGLKVMGVSSWVGGSRERLSPWHCCQIFSVLGKTQCDMSLLGRVLRSTRLTQLALNPWLSSGVSAYVIQRVGGAHRACSLCSHFAFWVAEAEEPKS